WASALSNAGIPIGIDPSADLSCTHSGDAWGNRIIDVRSRCGPHDRGQAQPKYGISRARNRKHRIANLWRTTGDRGNRANGDEYSSRSQESSSWNASRRDTAAHP